MKKYLLSLIILASSSAIFADEIKAVEVQILGTFGVGFQKNGDMDSVVNGYGDYLSKVANYAYPSGNFEGSESKADTSLSGEGELRVFFNQSFGGGLSVGYISTKSKSEAKSTIYTNTASGNLNFTAVPLLGTFYYMIPLSDDRSWRLIPGAGFGLYLNPTIKEEYSSTIPGFVMPKGESYKAKSSIGVHAKVEIQKIFHSYFALSLGGFGRYAEFKDFKGNGQTLKNASGKNLKASYTGGGFYLSAGLAF